MSQDPFYTPETPAIPDVHEPAVVDPEPDRDIDKLRQFAAPRTVKVLDLELRPYTAHTAALMELSRYPLKCRLDEMEKKMEVKTAETVKWRNDMAEYYAVASALYIHSQAETEVDAACWDPGTFYVALKTFLDRYTVHEIMVAQKAVRDLVAGANKAKDWDVSNKRPPPPNCSRPSGSRATSAGSRTRRAGRKTTSSGNSRSRKASRSSTTSCLPKVTPSSDPPPASEENSTR